VRFSFLQKESQLRQKKDFTFEKYENKNSIYKKNLYHSAWYSLFLGIQVVPQRVRPFFFFISQQLSIGFATCLFILKTLIHIQILNTFLCDSRSSEYAWMKYTLWVDYNCLPQSLILFCKFLCPLKLHRNGHVFKLCVWISVFRRNKWFANPILVCRDIEQNPSIFFGTTLYKKKRLLA